MPRGRPKGAISFNTYKKLVAKYYPKRFKEILDREVKREVKQEVKQELGRGRPKSTTESMRVLGGKLRVQLAKSRVIRLGNKEIRVG